VNVQAKRSTLPAALKLLGEILREPAFPAADFDELKRKALADATDALTDPGALASNRLARALSPYKSGDVRYVPTLDEGAKRLEAVTLSEVIALYEKQLGASEGELAVVGDFDAEETLNLVQDMLRGWKSDVTVRRLESLTPLRTAGLKEDIRTPDKANAFFYAGLGLALKDTDPDFAAVRMGNYLLGGGTLSSRLGNRIRQKEGLSYGVSSSFSASSQDPSANFMAQARTNPLNIDRVEKAFREELQEFLAKGPTATELADAKKAMLEAQKVGRTSDGAIAGQIAAHLRLGRTFAFEQEQEKRIAALTPDDVRAAFARHIDPQRLVIVRAGDFKK
jgi:zinc protease